MIQRARIFALALTLTAAACGSHDGVLVDPEPIDGVSGSLSEQRQLWERQGVDDYRVAYSHVCFCPQRGPVQVTVLDGEVVDVRLVESGERLPRERFGEYLTVDALFDALAAAQERNEYTAVRFHPTLGYPVQAEIGTLANDAGVRHLLSGLVRID